MFYKWKKRENDQLNTQQAPPNGEKFKLKELFGAQSLLRSNGSSSTVCNIEYTSFPLRTNRQMDWLGLKYFQMKFLRI